MLLGKTGLFRLELTFVLQAQGASHHSLFAREEGALVGLLGEGRISQIGTSQTAEQLVKAVRIETVSRSEPNLSQSDVSRHALRLFHKVAQGLAPQQLTASAQRVSCGNLS